MGNLVGLPMATLPDLAPPPPPPPLWGFHRIPPLSATTGTAPSPPTAPSVAENFILWVAAVAPVLLALVPLFILLVTGCVSRTVRVFRTPAMLAGVANSLLWLFYCLIVQRSDYSWIDAVTSNGFMLVLNYSYLMIVYSHRKCLYKGIALSLLVVPCIVFLFAAMRWKTILPEKLQLFLGTMGLVSLFITYVCQIGDINHKRGKTQALEAIITAVNFTPSLVFNAAVCYVTWVYHQDEVFLWLSSSLNCICSLLGIFLLMEKVFKDYCSNQGDDNSEASLPISQNQNNTNPLALGGGRTSPNASHIFSGTSSGRANPLALGYASTSSNATLLASRSSSSGYESSLHALDVDHGRSSSEFVTSAIEGKIKLDDIHVSKSEAAVSPSYSVTIGEENSHSLAPTSTGHRVLGCSAPALVALDGSEKLVWDEFEPGGPERAQPIRAHKSVPLVGDSGSRWCCIPKKMCRRRMHKRDQGILA